MKYENLKKGKRERKENGPGLREDVGGGKKRPDLGGNTEDISDKQQKG